MTDEARIYTDMVWNFWKKLGVTPRMSWIELNHLANYLMRRCKEAEIDYQTIDFRSILDASLTYDENRLALEEEIKRISGISSIDEMEKIYAEALTDLDKDEKITDLELKISELEQKLKRAREETKLEKNVREYVEGQLRITKAQLETQKTTVSVKIIQFIPAFIGSDGKAYGPFYAGQVVELPEPSATHLIRQRLADPYAKPTEQNTLRQEAEALWSQYTDAVVNAESERASAILARLKEIRPQVIAGSK